MLHIGDADVHFFSHEPPKDKMPHAVRLTAKAHCPEVIQDPSCAKQKGTHSARRAVCD